MFRYVKILIINHVRFIINRIELEEYESYFAKKRLELIFRFPAKSLPSSPKKGDPRSRDPFHKGELALSPSDQNNVSVVARGQLDERASSSNRPKEGRRESIGHYHNLYMSDPAGTDPFTSSPFLGPLSPRALSAFLSRRKEGMPGQRDTPGHAPSAPWLVAGSR